MRKQRFGNDLVFVHVTEYTDVLTLTKIKKKEKEKYGNGCTENNFIRLLMGKKSLREKHKKTI